MRDIYSLRTATVNAANQLVKSIMSDAKARSLVAIGSVTRVGLDGGAAAVAAPAWSPSDIPRSGLPVGLALVAACGAAVLAFVASRASEPLILTLMAALATVGVFFLFALASKHLKWGAVSADAELLRGILDTDETGISVTDTSGRMLARNKSFALFAGLNALGEINSLEVLLSSHPSGAECLFRMTRAAERGETAVEQLRIPGLQGAGFQGAGFQGAGLQGAGLQAAGDRWLRLTVRPMVLPQPGGELATRIWKLEDVTAERRAHEGEKGLLEGRLAQFAGAPAGLLIVDRDGQVLSANDRLASWLGYSDVARLPDFRLSDLVADGGAHLLMALGHETAAVHRCDLDLICENGRRWPATLLVEPTARCLSIAVVERIEDDDAAKLSLSGTQPRFSRFFQSAPFGIAAVDAEGRILSANPAFARLLLDGTAQRGGSLVELLQKSDAEIGKKIGAALEAAREGKANIAPIDLMFGVKNSELTRKVYVSSLARGSAEGPRESAILYVIDTTEAKALEQKFAQAQKMEAVGTLAGGIAHDFNNVLTAIIGFSDLLLQTHKPGNNSHSHVLSIKQSANRAAGLVRQLLAFSRRQTMQPRVLQMGDLLTDWSMLVNRLLGEKIELKILSVRDLWHVKADPSELERIIINLAVNARDAMLPKGGRLTIRTKNITERDSQKLSSQGIARAEYVAIEVEDNGSGMTPEIMAKIFDPFFTTKAVGKGTGLGLASVYGIVQQTGGYIIPESTPGEGTTFRVYLPRYTLEPEDEVEPMQAAKKPRPRDLTGTGRVMLVEDEEAVRRFAVTALKSKGYEVLQAGDGVEALEVFAAHGNKVDIVVSDVIMPEMDGPTLMKEMRKIDPDLKFIFVSGYPDDAFKQNLDPEADFTFLPKPYNLAQLAAQVKEKLEE